MLSTPDFQAFYLTGCCGAIPTLALGKSKAQMSDHIVGKLLVVGREGSRVIITCQGMIDLAYYF